MKLARVAISPLGAALGMLKPPKTPSPIAAVTRDDAALAQASDDELARRRGGAADIFSGKAGAAAPTSTGKTTLGS